MNPLAACPNPFRASVVADPWQTTEIDVSQIHGECFDLLRRALEHVQTNRRSTGVLLHGEAGSGKTHLLARFRRRLAEKAREQSPEKPGVVFVSVPMRTSPHMLWRHLRRQLVDDLNRRVPVAYGPELPLERVLAQRLGGVGEVEGDRQMWWEYLREAHDAKSLEERLNDMFDQLDQEAEMGRDLCVVLTHLLLGRHRRDARAWLRGDSLPENVLKTLNVTATEEAAEDLEERSRRTVLALCRLVGDDIPLVFSFDQLESLQVHPDDTHGLFAFGKMFGTLHAQTRNALLVTCVQSSLFEQFENTAAEYIRKADRERIHEFGKRALKPLLLPAAKELVSARLAASLELSRIRHNNPDPLWPLTEAQIRQIVAPRGCAARVLLARCGEVFDKAAEHADAALPPLGEYLSQLWEERVEQAMGNSEVDQSGAILEQGLPLLLDLSGEGWRQNAPLGELHLVFAGPDGRVGVSLCNQASMKALEGGLRRLKSQLEDKQVEKVIVLRDPRLSITKRSKATRQHLDDLARQDVPLVHPTREAIAALDALRTLLADAKSGDLALGESAVDPRTVRQWLAAHLPASLHTLLETVVSPPKPVELPEEIDLVEDLLDLVSERRVLSVAEAAAATGHSQEEVTACLLRRPEQFGFLAGPPAILFEYVPEAGFVPA